MTEVEYGIELKKIKGVPSRLAMVENGVESEERSGLTTTMI